MAIGIPMMKSKMNTQRHDARPSLPFILLCLDNSQDLYNVTGRADVQARLDVPGEHSSSYRGEPVECGPATDF